MSDTPFLKVLLTGVMTCDSLETCGAKQHIIHYSSDGHVSRLSASVIRVLLNQDVVLIQHIGWSSRLPDIDYARI